MVLRPGPIRRLLLASAVLYLVGPVAAIAASETGVSLTLVSRSGRQQEVAVREIECGPQAGCEGYVFRGPGIGLKRAGVVRPGERVRFTGIEDARAVSILVYRLPNDCSGRPLSDYRVARIGRKNVGGSFRFIQLSPDGRWTASLKPGFYSLSSSVEVELSTPAGGSYLHAGLLGIQVSSTKRLGTTSIPIPRC